MQWRKSMLKDELKKYFGYDDFRNGQEETIQYILDGHDVLSILSTGAGKKFMLSIACLYYWR